MLLEEAKKVTDKPSLIPCLELNGVSLSNYVQGKHNLHGNKLGGKPVSSGLKQAVGFDPEQTFVVDSEVLSYC